MLAKDDGAGIANDASNLTPNPFPSGKGNRNVGFTSKKWNNRGRGFEVF